MCAKTYGSTDVDGGEGDALACMRDCGLAV